MSNLFRKNANKVRRRRSGFANKSMLGVEALENRRLLAADFQTVVDGGEIFIEARGTEFQDRFTVSEVGSDHKIKIKIDFEIDAKNDGVGDFGQFRTDDMGMLLGDGTAEDLKGLTFDPGDAEPGANPGSNDEDSAFFDSIEASYDLNLLEFSALLDGFTFGGVRINQTADVNDPAPGSDGSADADFIDLTGLRDYDDDQFTLNGGTGDDIIKGGLQGDIINGGEGNDKIGLADNEDTISGGGGDADSVRYGAHSFAAEDDDIPLDDVEFVRGTNFHDVIDLSGNSNDVTIIGLGGEDTLTGGSGDDNIYGDDTDAGSFLSGHDDITGVGTGAAAAASDIINGNAGDDNLFGNEGNDLINGGDDNDDIFGDVGNDHLFGDAGNDEIFGDEGDDKLDGGDGNDDLFGGEGNDTLAGGDGVDNLDGGADIDTADFRTVTGPVAVDLADGDVDNDGFGNTGTITDVENVLGSDTAANFLIGDAEDNILRGGDADDTIVGLDGDDILIGRGGDDTLGNFVGPLATEDEADGGTVERGDDLLLGGLGDDSLRGGEDDDVIYGDGDLDVEEVITKQVTKDVTKQIDAVVFSDDPLADLVILEPGGADTIEGDGFFIDDTGAIVHLDSGDDMLNGNSGDDVIFASDAEDPFDGDGNNAAAADTLDILNGDAGDDLLFGHEGVDNIFGDLDQPAIDNPLGGGGDDVLFGLMGDDFLFGGNGSDTLVGGLGVDDLNGGTGSANDGNDILQIEAIGNELVDRSAFAGSGSDRFRITNGDTADGVEGSEPVSTSPVDRSIILQELDPNPPNGGANIFSDFGVSASPDDADFVDVSQTGLTDIFGSPLFIDVNEFDPTP